jgi:hypothetical protein
MIFHFDGVNWEVEYHVYSIAQHDYDIWLINTDDEQDTLESFELPSDIRMQLHKLVNDDVWSIQEDQEFFNDDCLD